jgi:hypothetical protein
VKRKPIAIRKLSTMDRTPLLVRWIPGYRIKEELNISLDTLDEWHRKGLPKYQLGRITLYKESELHEMIEKHKKIAPIKNHDHGKKFNQ